MSYYAGIDIHDIVAKNDNIIEWVSDKSYGEDLYVQGRRELHMEWGYACQMPFAEYCTVDGKPISFYVTVFDRPDLDGKLLESRSYDGQGNIVFDGYGIIRSIDFDTFSSTVRAVINEQETNKIANRNEIAETADKKIAEYRGRIELLMKNQVEAKSKETFDLFQGQIDRYYRKIDKITEERDDRLDYYDSGGYDHDCGDGASLLNFLDIAKKALADGKVVSVYGE